MSGAVPLLPLVCLRGVYMGKYHLGIFNEMVDVISKFKVSVYSPSLAAGSANGNIPEA